MPISHLAELRQESELIPEAIEEDNIDLIRNCDGNCPDCPRLGTCEGNFIETCMN